MPPILIRGVAGPVLVESEEKLLFVSNGFGLGLDCRI